MRTLKRVLVTTGVAAVAGFVTLGCENSKPLAPDDRDAASGSMFEGPPIVSLPSGIRIAGLGTVSAGGGTQSFDFDVADNLTGRLFYTDSRFPGASLTVDADPLTRIAAFRNGSVCCADRTRGAEFDGTGRRENPLMNGDKPYEVFTVVACDNGAAESGADFFRLSTVTQYSAEGLVTSGDIVKSGTASALSTTR